MKRTLLILGLIFSVAINAAVLTKIGHHWLGKEKEERHYREGKHSSMSYLYKELALSEPQLKEMELLRKSLESRMKGIKKELREKRVELVDLLTEAEPDRKKINEKSIEIETLQGNLQRLIIEHLLKQKTVLDPEQQKRFFSLIEKRFYREAGHHNDGGFSAVGGESSECEGR